MKALILGCGYLGRAVGKIWVDQGIQVTGWVFSEKSAAELKELGIEAYVGDLCQADDWKDLAQDFSIALYCAAPAGGDDLLYRRVYYEGLQRALTHLSQSRILFVSSTSVYGQTDGSVVSELSSTAPNSTTGQILRESEELGRRAGAVVLRASGIYGPGRYQVVDRLLRQQATMEGDGIRWMNRIHRDDLVSAVLTLAMPETSGGIYNVSDNSPSTQLEFYQWLADQLGCPLPPAVDTPLARKRGITNKRVSNEKLRSLGWNPNFSSFREGYHEYCTAWKLGDK